MLASEQTVPDGRETILLASCAFVRASTLEVFMVRLTPFGVTRSRVQSLATLARVSWFSNGSVSCTHDATNRARPCSARRAIAFSENDYVAKNNGHQPRSHGRRRPRLCRNYRCTHRLTGPRSQTSASTRQPCRTPVRNSRAHDPSRRTSIFSFALNWRTRV
jgi:hypothetical protein